MLFYWKHGNNIQRNCNHNTNTFPMKRHLNMSAKCRRFRSDVNVLWYFYVTLYCIPDNHYCSDISCYFTSDQLYGMLFITTTQYNITDIMGVRIVMRSLLSCYFCASVSLYLHHAPAYVQVAYSIWCNIGIHTAGQNCDNIYVGFFSAFGEHENLRFRCVIHIWTGWCCFLNFVCSWYYHLQFDKIVFPLCKYTDRCVLWRHIRRLFLHAQIGAKAIFTGEEQPWISISYHPVFTA